MNISVILCAHNPRGDHLARCLDGLRAQTLEASQWELLLIDNRSDSPIASMTDLSWCPSARILREEVLGLTAARLCGIRAAAGDLLVFVDADNVLDADFLRAAIEIAGARPFLGSWSGQCRPEFEAPPPEWTRRYWGNLVIREFDRESWSNMPRLAETMPCGAGLCVRRPVALQYLRLHDTGHRPIGLDRAGDSLLSGGDNDLAACACSLGLGMGLIPALKLTHLIPPERLTHAYLTRLAYGIHYSSILLDAFHGMPVLERSAIGRLADALRLARTPRPHRAILKSAYQAQRDARRLLARTPGLGAHPSPHSA